jgi:hypothetical protein
MDLNFKGLSTEATIGKILILVAFILKIVGVIVLLWLTPAGSNFNINFGIVPFAWVWTGALTAWALLGIAGIILLWKSRGKFKAKDYQGASVFALIAAFLPPIDVFALIGAILILVSPEVKKGIAKK